MWFGSEVFPIKFMQRESIVDVTGGKTKGKYTDFITRKANVRQVTGREVVEGGQARDSIDCIVRIRDGREPRMITAADRAILRDQNFEIVTVGLPNRSGGYIEMTLRRQSGSR